MELLKGKRVKAGQVIASLEDRDIRAARTEAEANLKEANLSVQKLSSGVQPQEVVAAQAAESSAKAALDTARALYERRRQLFEAGGLPQKELEATHLSLVEAENDHSVASENLHALRLQLHTKDVEIAQSKVEQAKGRLESIQAQVSYSQIVSPIDGVITDQFLYKGEMASAGAPVVTVMDLAEVIVKANFPEAAARKIHIRDEVEIVPSEGGESVSATITLVSPAADPSSRLVEVWATAKNPDLKLKPGAFVKATVTTETRTGALVIPASAVQFEEGTNEGEVATVDADLVAHPVKMSVGIRQGDLVEVLSGLSPGQTVIVEGNYGLQDNTKVRIQEQGK